MEKNVFQTYDLPTQTTSALSPRFQIQFQCNDETHITGTALNTKRWLVAPLKSPNPVKEVGMVYDQKLQGAICRRLHVFRIPAVYHSRFATLIDKWVACSGIEWTVKRLKSLKVDLFRIRSGLDPITPAKKRCDGSFYGVIGSLFRYAMKSDQTFESVLNAFMVYSLFKSEQLTQTQQEKFLTAVNAATANYPDEFLKRFASFMESQKPIQGSIGLPQSIFVRRGADGKKAPIPEHRSMPQKGSGLASLNYFRSSAHKALYREYESIYSAVVDGCDINTIFDDVSITKVNPHNWEVMGGEVHFLQEPGLKLRAIASPYLVHQVALQPLGSLLYRHMRTLPWDCTHDHAKPVPIIQSHLTSGRKVHSVDLSNATDYFPLEVQLTALRALIGNHQSIDLFEEISRSLWQSTIGTIRWNQGQPLGLFPSFASFGLTHGYLLLYLLKGKYDNQFFVLGDDVVILDDDLYDSYIHCLALLGCPYSPDKSLSSNQLAEFGGKVITSKRSLNAYKWRKVSDDNFLDLVRNYGRRAVGLLTTRQREVVDRVKHLTSPFGLNWSFENSNLEEMTRITLEVYRKVDGDEQSLTELYSTVNQNVYNMGTIPREVRTLSHTGFSSTTHPLLRSIDTERLQQLVRTFDEKVAVTLKHVFPEEWVSSIQRNSLLGGYAGVPRAVGITDLPLANELPSRVTQLERYRRILFT